MSQDFDWSNDLTLRFVEVLSTERALWDFNDPRYKMKQKVNDAWSRISAQMNIPVDILKNKKKILMASWRPLFRKKMASIRSGADEDEIFQPVWFAYDAMESFLGGVYDIDGTMNTEYLQVYEEPAASSPSSPSQQSDDASPPITIKKENQGKSEYNKVKILSTIKRKRIAEYNYDESQQNVNYSFDPLNPVTPGAQQNAQHRFHRSRAPRSEEEDECDIYAKLLARKLRRYPARMRDSIMFKIDGLLLDNPYPDEEASPCPSYAQPPYS